MKNVFLVLAIVGGIVPYVFFIDHFNAVGTGLNEFLAAIFANGAAGGFAADLLITSLVFWIYMWSQQTPRIWIYILVNLIIGLSCALPLYIYILLRREDQMAANDNVQNSPAV